MVYDLSPLTIRDDLMADRGMFNVSWPGRVVAQAAAKSVVSNATDWRRSGQ